jgi:hypothetical protein
MLLITVSGLKWSERRLSQFKEEEMSWGGRGELESWGVGEEEVSWKVKMWVFLADDEPGIEIVIPK